MINYFFINKILLILVTISGLWLAFSVYLNNKKSKTNQLFLIMMLLALSWIILCYFSGINTENLKLSLTLARMAYGTAILFLIPLYQFFLVFINKKKKGEIISLFILFGSIIISIFSTFTDFMAAYMVPAKILKVNIGVVPVLGYGKYIWFSFALFVAIVVIVKIFKKYLTSNIIEKTQLQYFLLGTCIFLIATSIFNVILPLFVGDARYYQFGNYSVIFLLGFTAYAIIKRNLFDIKIVLTALFVGLIAILLLFDALIFTQEFSLQIIKLIIFIIFLFFGRFLIKSVQLEIKRREELEDLTFKLENANVSLTIAYEKLERLDKAKSEFISIASHQLRTPLSAIKGYLSMVLEESYGKYSKKIKKPLENVYTSNERLIKLVNDLLSISRIEAGKIELEKEKSSIQDIVIGVIDELKIVAQKKNIYLKIKKPDQSLPMIMVDKNKLRQVILNIIDNAIRYTAKGGITVNFEIIDHYLRIIISDTGEGMSKEEVSKIFETFSRGKAGARFWTEGAGLGLYIAKKFTEMHKGKVWAESEGKGKGSVFYLELPV
jgi:signal transduction histidine kinase